MTGYRVVNLGILIEELGEDTVKDILSGFSCPLNPDVEEFLKHKAVDFVFASFKNQWVLVGYFALASKHITITSKFLYKQSKTLRKRISKFATYDSELKSYIMSAPLIAQLGKNYTENYNSLITGDELLEEACHKISRIQFDLGGKFAYLECEDKLKLFEFYSNAKIHTLSSFGVAPKLLLSFQDHSAVWLRAHYPLVLAIPP